MLVSGFVKIGAGDSQPLPDIKTERDAWELRHGWAEKSPIERLNAAEHISEQESTVALLTKDRLDAVFATKTPLIIVDGEALGPGDFVELADGETGYISHIRIDQIEIQRGDGVVVFETGALTERVGLCWPGRPVGKRSQRKIAIWPSGRNASMIIVGTEGLLKPEAPVPYSGFIAGVFYQTTIEGWIQSLNNYSDGNNGALVYPVRNLNLPVGEYDFQEYTGVPFSKKITLEEEINLTEGKLSEVIEYLNLSYVISKGVVTLNVKEK